MNLGWTPEIGLALSLLGVIGVIPDIQLQGFYCNQYTHIDVRNLPFFYIVVSSGIPSEDALDGESTGPLFWYLYNNHYQSVS